MKRITCILMALVMSISVAVPAFAAGPESNTVKGISRATVESIFSAEDNGIAQASVSSDTEMTEIANQERETFLQILPQIQQLRMAQQKASEQGKDTAELERQIEDLKAVISNMNSVVLLTDQQMQTLGIKPTVPGGSQYVECWGVDTTGRYGGKTYDVFEIYAAGLKYGGLGNPLGYQKEAVTLLTDSAWDNSTFAKDFYTDAKFVIGAFSIPFAVVDYLALSKMPDFFDTGSTQQLLLGYNALQTYCFQYVAEKGINWYDLMLTTEQVDFSETLTAISTGGPGKTRRSSKDRENMMIESSHYADANYAAQLLATNALRKEYHTGNIKYYVNGTMKHRVNFNSFSELYSIPGL